MSGYKISIDHVRKLSHLNVRFEEIIREVMMSQGRRFCTFVEPKCEQDNKDDSQNNQQQLKDSISELAKVHRTISHVDGFMARGECLQIINAVIAKLESI